MALTKLPKNAIGTGAIDSSKIEDGTIQNAELVGSLTGTQLTSTLDLSSKTVTLPNTSVTSNQLAGSIANNKLSNNTFTIRGTSRALGDSFSLGVDVDWQSVQTSGFTAVAGRGYFCNTTSAAFTVTLPASATQGDTIALIDYAGTFATNNLTIGRNGHNIQGVANNSLISTNRASLVLVYVDSTKGWLFTEENNVADLQGPTFISATGGTITTSGNFKIHSFTGDGTFVVSTVGNISTVPTGGPANVDYLVVAGGGAGPGGGAGGFRLGAVSPPAPPLAVPGGLTITATTYPITVGGGAAASYGTSGSPSSFSTITSTGGGRGFGYRGGPLVPASSQGGDGGSGGGGGHFDNANAGAPGGAGNTPPTNPSQGNPGGNAGGVYSAGGGGGAATSGSNGDTGPSDGRNGVPGGAGSPVTSIFGAAPQPFYPVPGPGAGYFSGGAGGPGYSFSAPKTGGNGGIGGGGYGNGASGGVSIPNPNGPAAGVTNSGGGAGTCSAGAGKGIVLIRYKFQ
jgi:hypothetical protein